MSVFTSKSDSKKQIQCNIKVCLESYGKLTVFSPVDFFPTTEEEVSMTYSLNEPRNKNKS